MNNNINKINQFVDGNKPNEEVRPENLFKDSAFMGQNSKNIQNSVLNVVPLDLPALIGAEELQNVAGKLGFDWSEADPVWAKFYEEIDEFKEAIADNDRENMEKEVGDVLFSLINLCRWYKISGENALNRTNTKFRQRFSHVEACVNKSDRSWEDFSLAELDAFWEEAKVQEK